ncbi:MAG: spike base protein, RCAP_Rcc01079 family [Rickettsiales bacterium]
MAVTVQGNTDPAIGAKSITPSDTADILLGDNAPRGVFVGAGGNLVVEMLDETNQRSEFTFVVSDGALIPIRPYKIKTSSTASNLVVIW